MTDLMPSILIVDDDEDICTNLKDIFSDLGYHVDVAHEGYSALEMIKRRPYDVALLDLKMPGMDGSELYKRIKEERAGTVAIVLSAHAEAETRQELLDSGASNVLQKPVHVPTLYKLVQQAMEQPLVLVVDDDSELCKSLWDLFRGHGLRVCIANDLNRAERLLSECPYKLVLLDMKLPDGSGTKLFRVIRECNPDTRIVLITGYPTEFNNLITDRLEHAADATHYKPFNMNALVSTMENMLGGYVSKVSNR